MHWVEALDLVVNCKIPAGQSTRQGHQTRQREEQCNTHLAAPNGPVNKEFLDLPSEADVVKCFQHFYEATSNDALCTFICGVCAWLLNEKSEKFSTLLLGNLPNCH